MIAQKNISIISNKSYGKAARRIPESVIERDYCLSWFLIGLSRSLIKDKLILKGGTALRRCYFKDYRFSEDLDFTLVGKITVGAIFQEFENIFKDLKEVVGITFGLGNTEPDSKNTHTFYLTYLGPLPRATKSKEIKVDITFNEKVITPLEEKRIIKTYEEYTDFIENQRIIVYSLNEIAIEKVCALLNKARNEPRDLYDLWYLVSENKVDLSKLVAQIKEKISFKGGGLEKEVFSKKEKRLKNLWEKRLSSQMSFLPEFEEVYRTINRAFRQANILSIGKAG